ncbi:hypothetical protein DTW90_00810 [Neorhizobium sp. P12A]|nr:hypothetical protein DTW90_00810 [Neorhizobium sp. P12A]
MRLIRSVGLHLQESIELAMRPATATTHTIEIIVQNTVRNLRLLKRGSMEGAAVSTGPMSSDAARYFAISISLM